MNRTQVHPSRERGIALVAALLILLVMTLLALVLMTGVSLNREVTGHDQRMRMALNTAEAGLSEAMSQIKANTNLLNPADPNAVAQVFLAVAGNVPALQGDSVGVATGQPVGSWLQYSTATRSPDALTIMWKKDPTGLLVMKYDPTKNPAEQTLTGMPIYLVRSTGVDGSARRTILAEVIQKPFMANCRAALAADVPIVNLGNSFVCGYDHDMNTSPGDGTNGRGTPVLNPAPSPDHCWDNELNRGTDLPAAWSPSTINVGGASSAAGSPTQTSANSTTPFYTGPWDALGMSQADFVSWIGAPQPNPSNLNGVIYVDNNSTYQDKSASLGLQSVTGSGLLYVDGDLHLNAGFIYKGLVYIEGDFQLNGSAWILGGVIVRGNTNVNFNGAATILYSSDAISQNIAKYGGTFVTLSWREI